MRDFYSSNELYIKNKSLTILNFIPLTFGLLYIIFTLVLFYIAPFRWQVPSYAPLNFYMGAFFILSSISFWFGVSGRAKGSSQLNVRLLILVGGILAAIMIFPSSYFYTQKWPWQIGEALADQNAAYKDLGIAVSLGSGSRIPVILARMITTPIIYPVIPLGIIYWSRLNFGLRLCVPIVIACSIIFSIMRGTTREIADIAVLLFAGYLILLARRSSHSKAPGIVLAHSLRRLAIISFVLLCLVITSLTIRAQARLGFQSQVCIGASGICADASSPIDDFVPSAAYFGFANASAYLSQGYFGLSAALDKEFDSSMGLGHSPALSNLASQIFGINGFYERSYTYRNFVNGWSDEYQWSTAATWVANDVGFPGSLVFFGFLFFHFGAAWRDIVYGLNDRAVPYFCIIFSTLYYFPANLQFASSIDTYATLIFWFLFWKVTRYK